MSVRTASNRVVSYTGTVHFAENGRPACAPVRTGSSWLTPTTATVTCKRCIAAFGADEPGHAIEPAPMYRDEHAERRAIERAARRLEREAKNPPYGSGTVEQRKAAAIRYRERREAPPAGA